MDPQLFERTQAIGGIDPVENFGVGHGSALAALHRKMQSPHH
jgi:hypothetical protein